MKKIVLPFLFSITLLSCSEKEKTYEELEAEVLCDVLPELIKTFIQIKLPPPPPPGYKMSEKENKNYTELLESAKKQNDSILIKAQQKDKIKIGLNSTLFNLVIKDFQEIKTNRDTIFSRKIDQKEVIKSTLKINLIEHDTVASWGEFIFDNNLEGLVSVSRVLIIKDKAYFKLYPFGCIPTKFKIISEKKNNKWVVKEIIKE